MPRVSHLPLEYSIYWLFRNCSAMHVQLDSVPVYLMNYALIEKNCHKCLDNCC